MAKNHTTQKKEVIYLDIPWLCQTFLSNKINRPPPINEKVPDEEKCKSWLKEGIIQLSMGRTEEAIISFDKILSEYSYNEPMNSDTSHLPSDIKYLETIRAQIEDCSSHVQAHFLKKFSEKIIKKENEILEKQREINCQIEKEKQDDEERRRKIEFQRLQKIFGTEKSFEELKHLENMHLEELSKKDLERQEEHCRWRNQERQLWSER